MVATRPLLSVIAIGFYWGRGSVVGGTINHNVVLRCQNLSLRDFCLTRCDRSEHAKNVNNDL